MEKVIWKVLTDVGEIEVRARTKDEAAKKIRDGGKHGRVLSVRAYGFPESSVPLPLRPIKKLLDWIEKPAGSRRSIVSSMVQAVRRDKLR